MNSKEHHPNLHDLLSFHLVWIECLKNYGIFFSNLCNKFLKINSFYHHSKSKDQSEKFCNWKLKIACAVIITIKKKNCTIV